MHHGLIWLLPAQGLRRAGWLLAVLAVAVVEAVCVGTTAGLSSLSLLSSSGLTAHWKHNHKDHVSYEALQEKRKHFIGILQNKE